MVTNQPSIAMGSGDKKLDQINGYVIKYWLSKELKIMGSFCPHHLNLGLKMRLNFLRKIVFVKTKSSLFME